MASASSNPPPTLSGKKRGKLRAAFTPLPSDLETAKGSLKLTLAIVEEALDGLPIPSAKGAVGGLLEVIKRAEVSRQALVIAKRSEIVTNGTESERKCRSA